MNESFLFLRVLPALLTILALGGGLVWLFWCNDERPKLAEWFGWSWILGTGGISFLLALFGLIFSGTALVIVVSATCLGVAIAGFMRQRRSRGEFVWNSGTPNWEKLFAYAASLLVALAAMRMLMFPMIWDGIVLWEHKARAAFVNGGSLPAWFFRDETRLWTHPTYPLGFPLAITWVYLWIGAWNQEAALFLFPCFLAAGTSLLAGLVARETGRSWLGTLSAVVLLCIPNFAFGKGIAGTGYADFPLAIAYLGALGAIFVRGMNGKLQSQWALAGACGAVCVWLKAEGMLLWITVVLVALAMYGWRNWRNVLLVMLPGFIVLAAWKTALWMMNIPKPTTFQEVSLGALTQNFSRLVPILEYMSGKLLLLNDFSLIWWLAGAALIQLWVRRAPEILPMTLAIVIPLGLYIVPYLLTRFDLDWHLATSCTRLIIQLVPTALFIVGSAAGDRFQVRGSVAATS